jgi:HEAT repeat protein
MRFTRKSVTVTAICLAGGGITMFFAIPWLYPRFQGHNAEYWRSLFLTLHNPGPGLVPPDASVDLFALQGSDPKALPVLLTLLHDNDPHVALEAAYRLQGSSRARDAIPILLRLIKEGDPQSFASAAQQLCHIDRSGYESNGSRLVLERIDECRDSDNELILIDNAVMVFDVLRDGSPEVRQKLISYLVDPSLILRCRAAGALLRIDPPLNLEIALPVLIKEVESKNSSEEMRGLAIRELGKCGPAVKQTADPVLKRALEDESLIVSLSAKHAIEVLAGKRYPEKGHE